MPVEPKLARLIKRAYASGFADLHQMPIEQLRSFLSHPKTRAPLCAYSDKVTPAGTTIRCYTPNKLIHSIPIIFLPGNAYILDRLDANNDYCSILATKSQRCVYAINNRLAPEWRFPTYLDEIQEAIEWLNFERYILWGESSGGNIAAVMAHLLDKKQIEQLVLFYPLVDMVTPYPSKQLYGQGYMIDNTFTELLFNTVSRTRADLENPLASPLFFDNFNEHPPTIIITPEYDPFRDEAECYAKKLRTQDIKVNYQCIPGMIHGFMRFYGKIPTPEHVLDTVFGLLG